MASNSDYPSDEGEHDGERGALDDEVDKPVYLMEHLATFTVTKETDIVNASDGMRRLLQLEKTNGIWSQKMQLCLERQWVLILDYETGTVMERFPVSMIQEPTAFTSNDPMEIYNNILVFTVGNSSEPEYTRRSEMHIFQCQSVSAQDLVEDLKNLRAGRMITRARDRTTSSAIVTGVANKNTHQNYHQSSPSSPRRQRDSRINSTYGGRAGVATSSNRNEYRAESDVELNDEVSSIASEKYERDVTVLNHCFDDIEKFIARLQHVAAASRELERRRRNRKSKKRDMGEGLLTMRTKPPPEAEFIDILQKFKLSFNLLAKLKAHIHDPNAPELVHFLFTPLALIVDASHETYYEPNLPSKVVSPLLTREAINLLANCVTSKETELWHSLGSSWLTSRDEWKGSVAPYHPVFMDGWSPDFPVMDENESAIYASKSTTRDMHDSNYGSEYFVNYEQAPVTSNDNVKRYISSAASNLDIADKLEYAADEYHMATHAAAQHLSARSDISLDSIEKNGGDDRIVASPDASQHAWLQQLQARGANVVQVTYPRTANNDKELTVTRGEYLEILDDSRKWWKARNMHGKVAHVPHTIVTSQIFAVSSGSNNGDADTYNNNNNAYARQVSRNSHRNDSARLSGGPATVASHEQHSQLSAVDRVRKEHLVSSIPAPPPLPSEGSSRSSTITNNITMNEKHTAVVSGTPPPTPCELRPKRPPLEIHRTPDAYITQKSGANEVQNWLRIKGFSDNARLRLRHLTGYELFSFTCDTLEKYLGVTEGKRCYSQLLIQKRVSGFQTVRTCELQAILAKFREKAEQRNQLEKQPPDTQ